MKRREMIKEGCGGKHATGAWRSSASFLMMAVRPLLRRRLPLALCNLAAPPPFCCACHFVIELIAAGCTPEIWPQAATFPPTLASFYLSARHLGVCIVVRHLSLRHRTILVRRLHEI
jgi:hypothetical protein